VAQIVRLADKERPLLRSLARGGKRVAASEGLLDRLTRGSSHHLLLSSLSYLRRRRGLTRPNNGAHPPGNSFDDDPIKWPAGVVVVSLSFPRPAQYHCRRKCHLCGCARAFSPTASDRSVRTCTHGALPPHLSLLEQHIRSTLSQLPRPGQLHQPRQQSAAFLGALNERRGRGGTPRGCGHVASPPPPPSSS